MNTQTSTMTITEGIDESKLKKNFESKSRNFFKFNTLFIYLFIVSLVLIFIAFS